MGQYADWVFAFAALLARQAFLSRVSIPPACLACPAFPALQSGVSADVQFEVEGEQMSAHKIILQVWRRAGGLPGGLVAGCYYVPRPRICLRGISCCLAS